MTANSEKSLDINGLAQLSRDYVDLIKSSLPVVTNDNDKDQLMVVIECLESSLNLKNFEASNIDKLIELYGESKPANEHDPKKAEELKQEGNALLKQQKYEEAIKKYEEALQFDPQNSILFYNRGLVKSIMNRNDEALVDLKQAVLLNAQYVKAHSKLSNVFESLKQYDEALKSAKTAADLDPSSDTYRANVSRIEDLISNSKNNAAAAANSNGMPPFDFSNLTNGGGNATDFNKIAEEFMKNPKYQEMAANIMSNPDFKDIASKIMGNINPGNM